MSDDAARARIAEILGDDPVCMGRVSSSTVAKIAALVSPLGAPDGEWVMAPMELLTKVRGQFDFYVTSHMAKQPPDMDKAATNQEFVEMLDNALLNAAPAHPLPLDPATVEACARAERMEDALEKIKQWADAYPLKIFPEPDFAVCASALKAAGQTLDAVSASNMRHAIKGVGNIARAALTDHPVGRVAGERASET